VDIRKSTIKIRKCKSH